MLQKLLSAPGVRKAGFKIMFVKQDPQGDLFDSGPIYVLLS